MHGQLAREFAEKAMKLHQETEFEQAAHRLVDLARDTMRGDHAAVLLVRDGVLETVDATDAAVEQADALENELHEGPSLAASLEHDVFVIDDTLDDEQWPRWSSGAAALGLRSVLSAQLPIGEKATGALTVYGDEPSRFDHETGDLARVLVQHAMAVTASARKGNDL